MGWSEDKLCCLLQEQICILNEIANNISLVDMEARIDNKMHTIGFIKTLKKSINKCNKCFRKSCNDYKICIKCICTKIINMIKLLNNQNNSTIERRMKNSSIDSFPQIDLKQYLSFAYPSMFLPFENKKWNAIFLQKFPCRQNYFPSLGKQNEESPKMKNINKKEVVRFQNSKMQRNLSKSPKSIKFLF